MNPASFLAERVSQHLTTSGPIVMLSGESNLPELLLSNDWWSACPGLGDFTCCAWGHADGSKCDRAEVGGQVQMRRMVEPPIAFHRLS